MSRTLEEFVPQNPDHITMYVCGPTVYSSPHIGNARPAIVFDVLNRILRHAYGSDSLSYVSNYTDVDDKIIQSANEQNLPISAITEASISQYEEDMAFLNVMPPDIQPKATEYVGPMIDMIQHLLERQHAYVDTSTGDILFHVPSNPYPTLAGHEDDSLRTGARVTPTGKKKDPRDFVLWKAARPGEPYWSSIHGEGRPGWHIECSAMIRQLLGTTIDIHGGGNDLRFPHHDAECAQSQCSHGAPLAKYWIHNGLLLLNGNKMSKSAGNIVLLKSLRELYSGDVIRLMFLQTHYRSPLNWTNQGLDNANRTIQRIRGKLDRLQQVDETPEEPDANVVSALRDDLNTSAALHRLFELADGLSTAESKGIFLASARLLGLFVTPNVGFSSDEQKDIQSLISVRNQARRDKNWAIADQIREQLTEMGVALEDGPNGTNWYKIGE